MLIFQVNFRNALLTKPLVWLIKLSQTIEDVALSSIIQSKNMI